MLSLPSRRTPVLLLAGCVLVPILIGPLVARYPLYGIVMVLGIAVLLLAARSIVYPVALAGVPSLLVGLNGSNPLPGKAIFALLTVWLLIGLAFAFMSGAWPASRVARRVLTAPILLLGGMSVLLIARLGQGAYPKTKVELFLAQGLPLLAAGVMIAFKARTFKLYLLVVLGVAVSTAAVLADKISTNQAAQFYPGRFTISTNYNPIWSAREAAIGVLIAVALILGSRSARSSLIAFAAMPLLGIALLSSGSRGPLVALLAALVVLVALTLQDRRTRSRLLRVRTGVLVAIIAVTLVVPGEAIHRSSSFLFGSTADLSSNGRTHLWLRALSLFSSHFWTGVGTGGFAKYEPLYQYPHNIVLEAGAELGVLGATIMVGFLFLALRTSFRAWSASVDREDKVGAALVAALLIATVVNALLSDAIESTDALCFTAGLAYGLRARHVERVAKQALAPSSPRPTG